MPPAHDEHLAPISLLTDRMICTLSSGPSSYDVKIKPQKLNDERPSANFISDTERDTLIEVNFLHSLSYIILFFFFAKDIPGPTAYDVSYAYRALRSQHRKSPQSKDARARRSQFLSAAKRTFAGEISSDTPGPGAYASLTASRPHGYAPIRSSRFHSHDSKIPGPADYEVNYQKLNAVIIQMIFFFQLSPLLQDTVLRGTFNSTLNNPILMKLQNQASKEQRAAAATTNSASMLPPVGESDSEIATHG